MLEFYGNGPMCNADLPIFVHDPVGTLRVCLPPLDPDGAAVHLGLVGEFPDIGKPHLHNGAGLISPGEGLVGAAPARHPGVTSSECKHDGLRDGGLSIAILSRQEC